MKPHPYASTPEERRTGQPRRTVSGHGTSPEERYVAQVTLAEGFDAPAFLSAYRRGLFAVLTRR